MAITVKTLKFYTGELRCVGFDFSEFPEVVEGETLSSPSVSADPGLTAGSPEVLTADFVPGDGDPTIASGKGVKVSLTASAAGTYDVTCQVTTSGGSTLKIRGKAAFEAP
jgi:hypothetical protein